MKRRKEKWPKAEEKKRKIYKAKGLSKERKKERKHKVLMYAKGIRVKRKK